LVKVEQEILPHVSSLGYGQEGGPQLSVLGGEGLVFPMKIAVCKSSKINSLPEAFPGLGQKGRDPKKGVAPRLGVFAENLLVKKITERA
jgi:hypothetical protein